MHTVMGFRHSHIGINFTSKRIYIYIYRCGDQLPLEVLLRLDRLGLWPNNPVRGRGHVRGRSVKEEMKIVLQEEVKVTYSGPKHIRGECSSRNFYSRWLKTSPSP